MALTPEQEARYTLRNGLDPASLKPAAREIYDRMKAEADEGRPPVAPEFDALAEFSERTSPEGRRRVLAMFKRANRKYRLPFDHRDRLAYASMVGGDWEEYGQIVLQMATLETLLSIEEKLSWMTDLMESGE